MKNTYKVISILCVAASLITGCNLDINEDPNRVTESTVTGALIFPAAAHETGQRIASGNFTFLNNWLGLWSGSGTFAIDQTETTYNVTPSFSNALWQNHYNTLFDLKQAERKALAANDTVLAGASIILASRLWIDLVDIFNNIPYNQAFDYTQYPLPAYDKGEDVYADLQTRLDLAISYMQDYTALSAFTTTDIVNGGDKAKWIAFANTLKLKMYIHQSELPGIDATATAAITSMLANGGFLIKDQTVSVNPGYVNETNKQSPFYGNYGKTINKADAAPSVKANKYFVDLLEKYGDQREYAFFDSTGLHKVVPTVYGLAAGNPLASSGNGPGLARSSTQDQWILTSVESLFLQAEAIARGWMPGNDKTAFKAAVTESFNFLDASNKKNKKGTADSVVTATVEAQYYLDSLRLSNGSDLDNSAVTEYPTAGSLDAKVKFIAFQKYMALAGIDPVEIWDDVRRLGFDYLPTDATHTYITQNPSKLASTVPIRLPYPQNEYTTNAANVSAEGTIDQFNSKIFWDVD